MMNAVLAKVSEQTLRIVPDETLTAKNPSEERSFTVEVTNHSDRFASFQVELIAEGTDPNSALKWYEVQPEICAKIPPSDRTLFKVRLTKAPIPAYSTEVKVMVKVLSVESEKLSTSQTLTIQIGEPQKPLKVELPFKNLKVYPGDQLEIPVTVYNLSSQLARITVKLIDLDPTWVKGDTEKTIQLGAGTSTKNVVFFVEPPRSFTAMSRINHFTIEAIQGNNTDSDLGCLEVMPFGIVEVLCAQRIQKILKRTAEFPLRFHNQTNEVQEIQVNCQKADQWTNCEAIDPIKIEPNGQAVDRLKVERSRPWLGWRRRAFLQLETTLSNPASGKLSDAVQARPATQTLELLIYPRIPVIVQAGVILLAGIWSFMAFNRLPSARHNAPITSIRISSDGSMIYSASNDKTVRRWRVTKNLLPSFPWQSQIEVPLSPEGDLAGDTILGKGIRVIRIVSNEEIAVGKENGAVELWKITSPSRLSKRLTTDKNFDRVFDLAVNDNTLFSGHGSGTIKFWDLSSESSELKQLPNFKAAISALAIDNQNKSILIAGQYNQIARWKNGRYEKIPYYWDGSEAIFTQNHYINSIAIATREKNHIAVTADNAGYITTWNLEKTPPEVIHQWKSERSVRAVAISNNGCFVASAGNDGRLMLYTLKGGRKEQEQIIANNSLRTVDMRQDGNQILIASDATTDASTYEVKLYRIKVNHHDCQ